MSGSLTTLPRSGSRVRAPSPAPVFRHPRRKPWASPKLAAGNSHLAAHPLNFAFDNGTRPALLRLASDFEIADRDGKSAISS
jgi:hypothetical protein